MQVQSAEVIVLGWENTSFTNSLLNSDAKLLKFLKQEIDPERLGFNDSLIDDDSLSADGLRKVMVVPALPAGLDRMRLLEEHLRKLGLHGILTLKSILENLFRQTLPNKLQMGGGEILHLLQMIKSYQLFVTPRVTFLIPVKSDYATFYSSNRNH